MGGPSRDSLPEHHPLLKPIPLSLSLSTHKSKGERSLGKISVIGHRPFVLKAEDTVKL